MAAREVCELEIAHLFAELAEKDDALVAALQDREAYQLLAKLAVERNVYLTTQNARLRACVRRSVEETYGVEPPDVQAAA